ncbi:gp53-like domain-containing protein [Pseudomonas chlororaphis]
MSQSDYAALTARLNGFSAGTAASIQLNKVWRQASIMAAMIGQFIVDNNGTDAIDDGTIATLLNSFKQGLNKAGVTAPQFDSTTKLATTEFVQKSLGSMAGVRVLSAGASLTANDVGHVVVANITSGGVINLPGFSSLYAGARFYIQCGASSGAITVNAPAGMSFGAPNASGNPTSITVRPGVAQDFIYISSATILVTNGAGIAQLGTSGYELSPNGKILQWVRVSSTGVTPNVFQTITLPLTAPNGVLCAFGSNCSVSQSDTFAVNVIENNNSTIRISWSSTNGGAAGARIFIVCN